MVNDPQVSQAMKDAPAYLFGAGLAFIAVDSIAYLFSWRHAGLLFATGMMLCLGSALYSSIRSEKAKTEDLVVVGIGAAFFAWLLLKQFF